MSTGETVRAPKLLDPIEELSRKLLGQILILPKTGIGRFLRQAIGFAVGIFVLGGALIGYWGPFWPTDPEIHAVGPNFSLPFSVLNGNNWYDVNSITIICALGGTTVANPRVKVGFNTSITDDANGIPRGGKHNYWCNVAMPELQVKEAEMVIVVKYLTAWHGMQIGGQRDVSQIFHWQYGQWIEGPLS